MFSSIFNSSWIKLHKPHPQPPPPPKKKKKKKKKKKMFCSYSFFCFDDVILVVVVHGDGYGFLAFGVLMLLLLLLLCANRIRARVWLTFQTEEARFAVIVQMSCIVWRITTIELDGMMMKDLRGDCSSR